jgi:hypothetical protein
MKVGDLVAFDDWLVTHTRLHREKRPEIIGVIVEKGVNIIPEPIARPNEVEVYWKIQIGDKTIHLAEHLFRKVS